MRKWRDIIGYEGRYQVSNDGFVRSLPDIDNRGRFMPGRVLRAAPNEQGRLRVVIDNKTFKVHRLVAFAFLPAPLPGHQVNHKDGNRQNNHVDNLEWCTASENVAHSYRVLGRVSALTGKTGALCKNSKRVRGIRVSDGAVCEYDAGMEAARELGIDSSGISMAARGKLRSYKGWMWEYI